MKTFIVDERIFYHKQSVIKNEAGQVAFVIRSKYFSLGHNFRLQTANEEDLLWIKQKPVSILKQYDFLIGNEVLFSLKEKSYLALTHYYITKLPWRIEGDLRTGNYDILDGEERLLSIRPRFKGLSSFSEIQVLEEEYTVFLIGMVVALAAIRQDLEMG